MRGSTVLFRRRYHSLVEIRHCEVYYNDRAPSHDKTGAVKALIVSVERAGHGTIFWLFVWIFVATCFGRCFEKVTACDEEISELLM